MTTAPWADREIAIRGTVQEIIKVYDTEMNRIREAYATLEDAGKKMTLAFGKVTTFSDMSAFPSRSYSNPLKEVERELKYCCWKNVIARLGIRKIMSNRRRKSFDEMLEKKDNLPDITADSVVAMCMALYDNINEFAVESIQEVYQYLHASPGWGLQYKTNQKNAFEDLGYKVIKSGVISNTYGGGFEVNYYQRDDITQVDRVFHNLDGKPLPDDPYWGPLVTAIGESHGSGETNYFRFNVYQNGNLHLEFKRMDLVKKFNLIANDETRLKSGRRW